MVYRCIQKIFIVLTHTKLVISLIEKLCDSGDGAMINLTFIFIYISRRNKVRI